VETRRPFTFSDTVKQDFNSSTRVFTEATLASFLRYRGTNWGLPRALSFNQLLALLLEAGPLRKITLRGPSTSRILYVWGDVSPHRLALALRKNSFLSHGTAAMVHGLIASTSFAIYANKEQREKRASEPELTQAGIDAAFSRPQRLTKNNLRYGKWNIVMVNGKYTGRLGVIPVRTAAGEELLATNLERTLIDIVVRPAYAGGHIQVLTAFRAARGTARPDVLVSTLHKLAHVYPYHQAIGFLMERAGFSEDALAPLFGQGARFDFYVSHGIKHSSYDKKWRVFYPKDLG